MDWDNLYDYLMYNDFLGWTRPMWQDGNWTVGNDGKLYISKKGLAVDTPWVHHGHTDWADCMRWHTIAFNIISKRMKMLFPDLPNNKVWVPTHCQNCWKTVVTPQTVLQLFALNELQENTDRPCKCGIEVRPTTEKHYGGYFYARGYENGHEMYRWVRDAVDNHKHLGKDVPVILKRACTEMEIECGRSDKWETTDFQLHLERLISENIGPTRDDEEKDQPENILIRVKRKWLEFAADRADFTYMHFTGGKKINKPYVTYHDREFEDEFPLKDCYG
jgi:hypothetical protein